MATLLNGMPFPYGVDFTNKPLELADPIVGNEPLNSSNEHLHNHFSSSGQNVSDGTAQTGKNLWQYRNDQKLTGHYNFGAFNDYNDFDIKKWGQFLNPSFASYT